MVSLAMLKTMETCSTLIMVFFEDSSCESASEPKKEVLTTSGIGLLNV